jgi:hypothetical protein
MSLWLQHLLVLALVIACLAVVGRQLIGTFSMTRRGAKLGSCCAKGCDAQAPPSGASKAERVIFIPSSTLKRRS